MSKLSVLTQFLSLLHFAGLAELLVAEITSLLDSKELLNYLVGLWEIFEEISEEIFEEIFGTIFGYIGQFLELFELRTKLMFR